LQSARHEKASEGLGGDQTRAFRWNGEWRGAERRLPVCGAARSPIVKFSPTFYDHYHIMQSIKAVVVGDGAVGKSAHPFLSTASLFPLNRERDATVF